MLGILVVFQQLNFFSVTCMWEQNYFIFGNTSKVCAFKQAHVLCREAALRNAKTKPLVSSRSIQPQMREKYPFVFDMYEEARQSSAYVSGTKVRKAENLLLISYQTPGWGRWKKSLHLWLVMKHEDKKDRKSLHVTKPQNKKGGKLALSLISYEALRYESWKIIMDQL